MDSSCCLLSLCLSASAFAQEQTQKDSPSELSEPVHEPAPLPRKSIAILPPKGNLEEWPEFEVEAAFLEVKLFQQAGLDVIGPGLVTDTLKKAGTLKCTSVDWVECALAMRQTLATDLVAQLQVMLRRGKPDQLTLLIVGEDGIDTSYTMQVTSTEQQDVPSTSNLIEQLLFEALPEYKPIIQARQQEDLETLEAQRAQRKEQEALLASRCDDWLLNHAEPTETQYPILGPSLLAAAGITLTSLAIATVAQERCTEQDPGGLCLQKDQAKSGAVLGMGLSGGALFASGVLWFVLGREDVPIQHDSEETPAEDTEESTEQETTQESHSAPHSPLDVSVSSSNFVLTYRGAF